MKNLNFLLAQFFNTAEPADVLVVRAEEYPIESIQVRCSQWKAANPNDLRRFATLKQKKEGQVIEVYVVCVGASV